MVQTLFSRLLRLGTVPLLLIGILPSAAFAVPSENRAQEIETATLTGGVFSRHNNQASDNKNARFPDRPGLSTPVNTDPIVEAPILPGACSTTNVIYGVPNENITVKMQNLVPGQTLVLPTGGYKIGTGASHVITNSGTQADPICVVAQTPPQRADAPGQKTGNVIIRAQGRIQFDDAQWWRIEGVDFQTRSIQLNGSGQFTPLHMEFVNNFHTNPDLSSTGDSFVLNNVSHVGFKDSIFSEIRSNQKWVDRHAIALTGWNSHISYTGNLCENVSADCIQAQGHQPTSSGMISHVLVEGNTMRINRPRVIDQDDPFCNTGENAIDVKVGLNWIIRNNTFSGFQKIDGCVEEFDEFGDIISRPDFESTSSAGDAVVLHKNSGTNFLIENNVFTDNTTPILIIGKGCTAAGQVCGGSLSGENIVIRSNTFDNSQIDSTAIRIAGVKIYPGQGSNVRTLGVKQFTTPQDVAIRDNTFIGEPVAVEVTEQTKFKYGQTESERTIVGGVETWFDPAPGGRTVPIGTTVEGNIFNGASVEFDEDIDCFGDQCPAPPEALDCSTANIYGRAAYSHSALATGTYDVWARIRTGNSVSAGVQVRSAANEVYCDHIVMPDTNGAWQWVKTTAPLNWSDTDADVTVLGLGRLFDIDCVVLSPNVYFTPTTEDDCVGQQGNPAPLPPVVAILSPSQNEVFDSSAVTVDVSATDPDGTIASVEFVLNGDDYNSHVTTLPPYSNTYSLPDGTHIVEVVATDNSGLETSENVTFSIDTSSGDELFNFSPNPSFEQDAAQDYFISGAAWANHSWDNTVGLTGQSSLKLVGHTLAPNGKSSRWITKNNRISASPGVEYTATAFIKTDSILNDAEVGITYWKNGSTILSGSWSSATDMSGTNDWTEVSMSSVAPPETTFARLEMRIRGIGTVWFDDVSFTDGVTTQN